MNYPLKDRKEFALWAHASVCFQNCADACASVIESKLSPRDRLYKPLTVYAVIEYAKPFKRSRGLGTVPEIVIPKNHMRCHELVISVRDKIAAHIDTAKTPEHDLYPHCVRIEIGRRGVACIVEEPKVHPDTVSELKILAEALAATAHYQASKHTKKMYEVVKRSGRGKGEYLIDVESPENGLRRLGEHEKARLFWD